MQQHQLLLQILQRLDDMASAVGLGHQLLLKAHFQVLPNITA